MKVLVLAKLDKLNSFKQGLKTILESKGVETIFSLDAFWEDANDIDIVFFHWEEYLVKAEVASLEVLQRIEQRLKYWKDRSKLIILKHNLKAHTYFENHEKLFELVNRYQDGVIHMGKYSKAEYDKLYQFSKDKKHVVIPHQWYNDTPNGITKEKAREKLNIPKDQFVMLVFGAIRKSEESKLIFKAFKSLNVEKKVLLISNWRGDKNINKRKRPFLWLWLKIKTVILGFNLKYRLNQTFIKEEDIQVFMNASNILFIPRVDSLNSGNIPLGFTFGKVVVGSKCGNMGELLEDTDNPVFEPNSLKSIKEAMNKAYLLSQGNKGEENRMYAEKEWNYDIIGDKYVSFFNELLNIE